MLTDENLTDLVGMVNDEITLSGRTQTGEVRGDRESSPFGGPKVAEVPLGF